MLELRKKEKGMSKAAKPIIGLGVIGSIIALVAVGSLLRTYEESASDPKPNETMFYGKSGYSMPVCSTPADLVAYAQKRPCSVAMVNETAEVEVLQREYRPRVSLIRFKTGRRAGQVGWVFTHHLCRTSAETPTLSFPSKYF